MSRESLRIIHDEHDALSAMLRSIGMMVDRGPGNDPTNFFDDGGGMEIHVSAWRMAPAMWRICSSFSIGEIGRDRQR